MSCGSPSVGRTTTQAEAEANRWLQRFVDSYNARDHRREPHSRAEDWLTNLPSDGVRAMCRWERFCTFAREPERRSVGLDCRLTVAGVAYEVDPELAGETVVVWWGLFDQELFVEHGEDRYGPYDPIGGPVPLHRYRRHRKSRREARAERVDALAAEIGLPRAALSGNPDLASAGRREPPTSRPFVDPDPFRTLTFANVIAAKLAIADALRLPLAKLAADDLAFINDLMQRTLDRAEVMAAIRARFPPGRDLGPKARQG